MTSPQCSETCSDETYSHEYEITRARGLNYDIVTYEVHTRCLECGGILNVSRYSTKEKSKLWAY